MKQIGAFKLTALVAGNMIGSGALLAPALLAKYGTLSVLGWLITMIGAMGLALVFSCLSVWITKAGGPYTFARHVFGDFVGFQMAWGYWLSAILGSVSLVTGTLQYASIFWSELSNSAVLSMGLGCGMIWLFTFINTRGLKSAVTVEIIILLIKILPLVIIAIAGFALVSPSGIINPVDFKGHTLTSLMPMSSIMLWAFLGLESATVPADSVENPKKSIPIATVAGVSLTALVYIGGAIAISGLIPISELLVSKAPYVDAGTKILGHFGTLFMAITGIVGIAGSLNGWILIQGQVPASAAEEGLFPKYFSKKNKYGASTGVSIGSVIMTAVFLLTYQPTLLKHVELMIDVAVFAMLIPYFYCVFAFVYMAFSKRKDFSTKEKVLLCLIGFIACLYSSASILSAGGTIITAGFIMFLLCVPFYLMTKKGEKRK